MNDNEINREILQRIIKYSYSEIKKTKDGKQRKTDGISHIAEKIIKEVKNNEN